MSLQPVMTCIAAATDRQNGTLCRIIAIVTVVLGQDWQSLVRQA